MTEIVDIIRDTNHTTFHNQHQVEILILGTNHRFKDEVTTPTPTPTPTPNKLLLLIPSDEEVMGGRLLNFSDNWKEWGTSHYVWNMINQGVRLSSNPSFWKKFHQRQFNQQESEWIRVELLKMLQLKIIGPGSSQIVLNPINVVPKKGKDIFRFILDLRMINGGIEVASFKMEALLKCIKF